jgi:hypothetical protein
MGHDYNHCALKGGISGINSFFYDVSSSLVNAFNWLGHPSCSVLCIE